MSSLPLEAPELGASPMLADYIKRLAPQLHGRYKRDFNSKEDFEDHKQQLVIKLRQLLGLYPWPEKNDLNPQMVGRFERDTIIVEKVVLEARPGYLVNVVLFIPNNAPPPFFAVINPQGHWPDGKYQPEVQIRCLQLARKGYIALTYDPIGQGERAWMGDHEDVRRQAILSGHSLSGMLFWDTMRCIDYLYTRPDVEKGGVGSVGLSGGGFNTLYTSVLDQRIKVSVPTVYATNVERCINFGHAGCCTYIPHLNVYAEVDDIYALIAPRPMLILAGGDQDQKLSGGAMQNYQVASKSYRLYGLDRLEVFIDKFSGHTISRPMREKMYSWFNKWLKGDNEPQHAREDPTAGLFHRDKGELDVFSKYQDRGRSLVDINKGLVRGWQKEWRRPRKRDEIQTYQTSVRKKLHQLLGDVATFGVIGEVLNTENRKNHWEQKIRLTTERGITLPAHLLMPARGEPSGVVLYLRTDESDSSLQPLSKTINQFLACHLAVMFVRLRGTWETNHKRFVDTDFHIEDGQRIPHFQERDVELYLLALGKNIFGMRVHDLIQTVEYLKSREDTRSWPILCVGEGLREGLLAIYATALDERITSAITNGGLICNQYFLDNSLYPPYEFFVPHILRYADTPEIVAAIAPRRVCLINPSDIITDSKGDTWQEGHPLPQDVVQETFAWTKQVYSLTEAPNAFSILAGRISYTNILCHD